MNSRKFYLIISSVLSICLFIGGAFLLTSINIPGSSFGGSLLDSIIEPLKIDNEPFNILVLGGDKVASNTDTIILVNYNPSTAKINMMSIPRDTKVNVEGSSLPKINSAYPVGGGKKAVEAVSNLLDINIKYYVFINTEAFRQIIDILGGVDYNVPVDMYYEDPTQDLYINLKKGLQHMNGEKAEQFMRFRQPISYNNEIMKYYDGSDLKRIEAQQGFIKELIKQKANVKYITKADDIIKIIFDNIDTNIAMSDAIKFTQSLSKLNVNDIDTFTLPGVPEEGGAWYYIINKSEAQKIVKDYFTGTSGLVASGSKSTNKPAATQKPKPASTPKPSVQPTESPKPTPEPTATPVPTLTPSPTPTPSPTSLQKTPAPTETPKQTPAETTKPVSPAPTSTVPSNSPGN